jgi:hypothetical protein
VRSKKQKTKTTAQNGDQRRASVRCEIFASGTAQKSQPRGRLMHPEFWFCSVFYSFFFNGFT